MEIKEQTKTLTLQMLKDESFGDVSKALNLARTFYFPYPEKPSRPSINPKATAIEARQYAESLELYEQKMVAYQKEKNLYSEQQNRVNSIIEDYIKELAGFNRVPEKSKSKVWSKAWSDGHSSGYIQVYYCLVELVDLF